MQHHKIMIIISALLILFSCKDKGSHLKQIENYKIDKLAAPVKKIKLDIKEETTVKSRRGMTFTMAKDSFVDEDGNTVNKDVTIAITEISSSRELAATGIPMTWKDKSGTTHHFETFSMFRIEASHKGSPLRLADGKTIKTGFKGNLPPEGFRLYKLTGKGTWSENKSSQKDIQRQLVEEQKRIDREKIEEEKRERASNIPTLDSEEDYKTYKKDLKRINISSSKSSPFGKITYTIDQLGWWNWDKPNAMIACLKGKIDFGKNKSAKKIRVYSMGISKKQSFFGIIKEDMFYAVALPGIKARIFIIDENGLSGESGIIRVTRKTGNYTLPEGKDNFIQDIGTIVMKK